MNYQLSDTRYDSMLYRRCGNSGLKLPAVSLGLWHNFGDNATIENAENMLYTAFDLGITHFDLANNYGPPAGSAEEMLGRILDRGLRTYRDELVLSTKAGFTMLPGPYGDFGSRKYLMSSLDQSLRRMKVDYVDIFYHHCPDSETPLEETMETLVDIVKSGKALYVGISNYNAEDTKKAVNMLAEKGVHCLIHQMSYSLLKRTNESVIEELNQLGVGSIAFSSLAQGLLTGKYNDGIPSDSRVATDGRFLNEAKIHPADLEKVRALTQIAKKRGQSIAQMSLAWVLRENGGTTSVIIGASKPEQITENCQAINNLTFSVEELSQIDKIVK